MATDDGTRSRSLTIGLVLTGIGLAAGLLAGPGTRLGLWSFRVGLLGQGLSALAAAGGGVCLAWGLLRGWRDETRPRLLKSAVALVLATVLVGVPSSWVLTARNVPMIHDITTDTTNPPAFKALRPQRRNAPNRVGYPGDSAARQQAEAYPAIEPLRLEHPPGRVFRAARATGRAMGWNIVDADTASGRMEAVDTTLWFGFRDDVVVRVTDSNGRVRVDVRSASRVGQSDLGTNARRIRRFLSGLEERLVDSTV